MALTKVKTAALSQGSSFLTSVATANLPAESVLQTVTSGIINAQFSTTSGAIYRDSTELYGSNARFGYQRDTSSGSLEIAIPLVLQHIDTPSTTSQITYGVYMSAHSGGTVWTNNHDRCIIAMELKG